MTKNDIIRDFITTLLERSTSAGYFAGYTEGVLLGMNLGEGELRYLLEETKRLEQHTGN